MTWHVLVAGAGPVGLTMAAELCRYGLSVRIIDKNAARTDRSKALAVWPRTLELMEQLGCARELLAAGTPCHGATIWAEGKKLLHVSMDSMPSHFNHGLLIAQAETERVLETLLEERFGVKVERNTELLGLEQDEREVRSRLRLPDGREETLATPWLAGCDGAHSLVRKTLGLEFMGTTSPTDWILADVCCEQQVWAEDEVTAFMDHSGVLAVFPFGGSSGPRRYRVLADVGERSEEHKRDDPTLEEVQALVDRRCPRAPRLVEPHWLAHFTINERKVSEYRRGRAFLAGDAAHIHSPFGGQGMNTGMQDACNLAWKLAQVTLGRGRSSLLDTYSPERSAVGDAVLRNAGRMTRIATLRHPVAQAIRNKVYTFLGNLELVQRKINQVIGELDIHYPDSPLSQQAGGGQAWLLGSGVHPGDRLPEAELVDPDGSPRRLHSLLQEPGWSLLLLRGLGGGASLDLAALAERVSRQFPEVRPHIVGAGGFGDPQGVVHRLLGAAHSAAYLVRPDGYVGFRGQPLEEAPLLDYLNRFLVPAG